MKKYIAFLVGSLLITTAAFGSTITKSVQATYRDIRVTYNNQNYKTNKEPFIVDGTVYMSIRDIANILGVQIDWSPNQNKVNLTTSTNQCTSNNNQPTSKPDTTTPGTTSTTSTTQEQYENEVLRLTNIERAKYGLSALTLESTLTQAARLKTNDLIQNNYFAHESPTYGSAFNMLKNYFGITGRSVGENLAAGYATPEAVVQGWMNSQGHRENLLRSEFKRIGIGYGVNSSGKQYWTQIFTS